MKRILHMALLGAAALGLNAPIFCHNESTAKIKYGDDEKPVVAYLASEETNLETYINQVSQKEKCNLKEGEENNQTKYAELQTHHEWSKGTTILRLFMLYKETGEEQLASHDQQNESITLPKNQEVKLDPKLAGNFNKNGRVHLFLKHQDDKSPRHIATWNKKHTSEQVIDAINQPSETNTNAQENNNSKATSLKASQENEKLQENSFLAGYGGFVAYWLVKTTNDLTGNPIGRLADRLFPGFVELPNNAFGRKKKHLVGSFALGTAVGTAVYLGSKLKTWFDETGSSSKCEDSDSEGKK